MVWYTRISGTTVFAREWKPDGKEIVVNREHRWMSDKKFVHVVDKVGEEIANVGILGVNRDTGGFTGWHFGKDGREDWWIKKETADVWLFGGAGTNGEWMLSSAAPGNSSHGLRKRVTMTGDG